MIKLIGTKDDFLEICDKIDLIKGVRLTQDRLYKLLVASIYHPGVFAFKSIENAQISIQQFDEQPDFKWFLAGFPRGSNASLRRIDGFYNH